MSRADGVSQSLIEAGSNHMKSIPDDQKEEEAEYIMNLMETKSEKKLIMLLMENDQLTRYKITT